MFELEDNFFKFQGLQENFILGHFIKVWKVHILSF